MSAEETKRELPPGCTPVFGRSEMCFTPGGVHVPCRIGVAWDRHDSALAILGITRDEYKAMQRDRRAMKAIREAAQLTAPPSLVWGGGEEWGEFTCRVRSKHAPLILAALGESS